MWIGYSKDGDIYVFIYNCWFSALLDGQTEQESKGAFSISQRWGIRSGGTGFWEYGGTCSRGERAGDARKDSREYLGACWQGQRWGKADMECHLLVEVKRDGAERAVEQWNRKDKRKIWAVETTDLP